MDKFLTDLAAHTGCDSVSVSYREYWHDASKRFHCVMFSEEDGFRAIHEGWGPTVEAAMNAATADKRDHDARAA